MKHEVRIVKRTTGFGAYYVIQEKVIWSPTRFSDWRDFERWFGKAHFETLEKAATCLKERVEFHAKNDAPVVEEVVEVL